MGDKSITFVMWGLGGSGGEKVIYEIAKELAKEGFNVRIVGLVGWNFKGINLESVKIFTQPKLFRPLFSIFFIVQFNKKARPLALLSPILFHLNSQILKLITKKYRAGKIIATEWYTVKPAISAGAILRFMQDVPEAYLIGENWPGWVWKEIMQSLKVPIIYLTISRYEQAWIKYVNNASIIDAKRRICHVGNFLRESFNKCESNYVKPSLRDKVIGGIIRENPHKGKDLLLKSLELLWLKRKDFKVVLWNPERITIKASFPFTEIGPLEEDEVPKFYASLYTFIYTSLMESFGLPPLEAMACGTPVVMLRNLGSLDYAKNNYNAIIINERDPVLIADAVSKLLDNPLLADELSINGLKTAREYKFSDFIQRFKSCINI